MRRAVLPALCIAALAAAVPSRAHDPAEIWRDTLVQSGPSGAEEPPHPEALHEWWFFTVQSSAGACGPAQAMVSFVADREAVHDQLLFTAVAGGETYNFSEEHPPGSLSRAATRRGARVSIGDSIAAGGHPRWRVHAETTEARLDLRLDAGGTTLWRRRAPEGWGVLEITFANRAAATGSLLLKDTGTRCRLSGAGYFEHVWGNWSRVPMWGVDYLNAHVGDGWSAYARHTPMRGEGNLFPRLGIDPEDYWPPVLILTNGEDVFEAAEVTFEMTESAVIHPDLGVPVPAAYEVTGSQFTSLDPDAEPPGEVTLSVSDPALATIFFETTSSGVLEGWGPASLVIDGVERAGASEIEFQRFGTTFPH